MKNRAGRLFLHVCFGDSLSGGAYASKYCLTKGQKMIYSRQVTEPEMSPIQTLCFCANDVCGCSEVNISLSLSLVLFHTHKHTNPSGYSPNKGPCHPSPFRHQEFIEALGITSFQLQKLTQLLQGVRATATPPPPVPSHLPLKPTTCTSLTHPPFGAIRTWNILSAVPLTLAYLYSVTLIGFLKVGAGVGRRHVI